MSERAPSRMIVVGASLGGLDVFRTLLAGLPPSLGAVVVLVQHRRPEPESRLAELLAQASSLPVREPDAHDPIEPGRIYLAPPGYHLLVERGRFMLSTEAAVMWSRPSIDVLFESAAHELGESLTGVLMTGANEDGALGLQAIDRAGGRTIVQDPDTARSPIAPRAALALFEPTRVLPVHEIAPLIVEWSSPRMEN